MNIIKLMYHIWALLSNWNQSNIGTRDINGNKIYQSILKNLLNLSKIIKIYFNIWYIIHIHCESHTAVIFILLFIFFSLYVDVL
jgi:hypothetical protein